MSHRFKKRLAIDMVACNQFKKHNIPFLITSTSNSLQYCLQSLKEGSLFE